MSNSVRFILDDQVKELTALDPTLTVLNYLRTVERKCGTKEGCAEGDCGACTVVLGERADKRVRYRAVNACILFTPTLDGKQLITVENLKGRDGSLHPVQRAMVECHGSQCGFCTPGFVMSLFALYKSETNPSHLRINDALAGNLCRCTGYRPIVDAARKMYAYGGRDQFAAHEAETLARLRAIERTDTLALAHDGRRYFAPKTLEALADLVLRHPDAHLLAGGTDVGLWVTKQHRELDTLIYTGDVAELHRLAIVDGEIEIGAAVTYTDALEILGSHYPDFGELIRRLGAVQIRNAGTIGGNIANASPIGDSMPALIALGAILVLRRGDERRELPLDEFFIDYRETALRCGEFVELVRLPVASPRRQFRAYKISKRFDQDISAVCAAFALGLQGGRVRDIRIGYGGMAAIPRRARRCEAALIGQHWSEGAVRVAMRALDQDFAPISDMRASGAYRSLVARNLLHKFFVETTGSAGATRVLEAAEARP